MSNPVMDDYDSDISIGDRVVLGEGTTFFTGWAGVVAGHEEYMSLFWGTDIVSVLLDDGPKITAEVKTLIKSPYQGEPLEEVPSV